jgi:hypothetical protein
MAIYDGCATPAMSMTARDVRMTKLLRVGFFREMPHGEPTDPSLAEARADSPAARQDALVAYLEAGRIYIATPSPTLDVIDGHTTIGPPHYLTDAIYVWPGDAAHYVRAYNARLPDAFVEHVAANEWTPPADVDLSQVHL